MCVSKGLQAQPRRRHVAFKHLSDGRQGVDGQVEVPFTRWELEEVWDPNPDAPGKMRPGLNSMSNAISMTKDAEHALKIDETA